MTGEFYLLYFHLLKSPVTFSCLPVVLFFQFLFHKLLLFIDVTHLSLRILSLYIFI